jgi:hypothetical protein
MILYGNLIEMCGKCDENGLVGNLIEMCGKCDENKILVI